MSNPRPESDLSLLALLYASGELEGAEAEAFEARLATDQPAREALVQAVELNATARGLASTPDPSWRDAAMRRLQPRPSLWQRLAGKRVYRGHPIVWTLGGAIAASVALVLFNPTTPAPTAKAEMPAPSLPPAEVANAWAELNGSEHLARVHDEQTRRKSRLDERVRMARSDGRTTVPTIKR
jgi:hypothetical protein